jgi:hypothetical protein
MNAVIDTGVAWMPASFHLTVCGIDNGVDSQGCNVAFPDNKPGIRLYSGECKTIHNAVIRYPFR